MYYSHGSIPTPYTFLYIFLYATTRATLYLTIYRDALCCAMFHKQGRLTSNNYLLAECSIANHLGPLALSNEASLIGVYPIAMFHLP